MGVGLLGRFGGFLGGLSKGGWVVWELGVYVTTGGILLEVLVYIIEQLGNIEVKDLITGKTNGKVRNTPITDNLHHADTPCAHSPYQQPATWSIRGNSCTRAPNTISTQTALL